MANIVWRHAGDKRRHIAQHSKGEYAILKLLLKQVDFRIIFVDFVYVMKLVNVQTELEKVAGSSVLRNVSNTAPASIIYSHRILASMQVLR
jgi:hypothetical protein